MTLIECVPNFSEGRRPEVVDAIVAAITAVDGRQLLDRQSDATHNRSVITFAGQDAAVAEGAFRGIDAAARLIDLNHARRRPSAHRRRRRRAVRAADRRRHAGLRRDGAPAARASRASSAYRSTSTKTRRARRARNLAAVREGFEELREAIASDPARAPDEGAPAVHPTAGAIAVGARFPLIAYNVNLESHDLELAKSIARAIRERDGGLPEGDGLG